MSGPRSSAANKSASVAAFHSGLMGTRGRGKASEIGQFPGVTQQRVADARLIIEWGTPISLILFSAAAPSSRKDARIIIECAPGDIPAQPASGHCPAQSRQPYRRG
jgi:hypothetical protein